MKNYKFVREFGKPYRKYTIWGNVLAILSIVFVLLLPQITQLFIDSVYTFTDTDTGNLGAFWLAFISLFGNLTTEQIILLLSISFILCAILKNVCSLFSTQNLYVTASEACGDVRRNCFKKLAFADKNISTNETFFNFTTDISDLYSIYYTIFPKMLTQPFLILLTATLCFFINWIITLFLIIFVPIILLVGFYTNKKSVELFKNSRKQRSDLLRTGEELIYEIREIKAFGNEKWANEKYEKSNNAHSKTIQDSNNYLNKCNFLLNILRALGIVLAVVLSAIACFDGKLSIGYFVLFVSYALLLLNSCIEFVNNYYNWNISFIGIERLTNFVSTKGIKEKISFVPQNPDIKFEKVSVILNDKKIFENLSHTFEFGKNYAIIINQGEGKTAFARLLLRFVPKQKGKILFGGTEYEDFAISSLRGNISYITQEPFIFEGTISENITMFEPLNQERLAKVIKLCELSSLVKKLETDKNYVLNVENILTQDRQKINIARALYRNSPILLIDSAFNKFTDELTDKLLEKIKKYYKDKTIIFLTARKFELKHFENVLKINNGVLEVESEEK